MAQPLHSWASLFIHLNLITIDLDILKGILIWSLELDKTIISLLKICMVSQYTNTSKDYLWGGFPVLSSNINGTYRIKLVLEIESYNLKGYSKLFQ